MEESQLPALIDPDSGIAEVPEVLSLTPAQARVNAVSNVLQKAYEKAGTLQLTPDETKALMADFPDEAFKTGAGGNAQFLYIEHAHLRDRFNEVLGLGQWAIIRTKPHWAEEFTTSKNQPATRVYAECAMIVRGCFVAEAVGAMVYYPNNGTQDYADTAEGAMTAAFRRCAKNFGVGIQAWKKDFSPGWFERQRQQPTQKGSVQSQNPVSPSGRQTPAPAPKAYQMKPAAPMTPMKATEKTRQWMLDGLKQFSPEDLLRFSAAEGEPLSALENWPLDKVPTSYAALGDLVRRIEDWMVLNAESLAGPPLEPTEAFWDVMISVPRAGTKRQEYLAAPDTVRSLYTAMKDGDEKAKTRLWGLAHEWKPAPYTAPDGKVWQPRPEDHECRAALDEFLEWEKSKGNLVE